MVCRLRVVWSTPGAAPAAWDVSRALQPLTSSCCSACRPLAAGTPMGLIVDDRGSRPAVDPPQTGTPGVPVCGRSTTGCRRRTKVRACPRSSHGTPALACAMCTYSLPRASLDRAQATGGGHRPEPPPIYHLRRRHSSVVLDAGGGAALAGAATGGTRQQPPPHSRRRRRHSSSSSGSRHRRRRRRSSSSSRLQALLISMLYVLGVWDPRMSNDAFAQLFRMFRDRNLQPT